MCFLKEYYQVRNNLDLIKSQNCSQEMSMISEFQTIHCYFNKYEEQYLNSPYIFGNIPQKLNILFAKAKENQRLIQNVHEEIDKCLQKIDSKDQQTDFEGSLSSKQTIAQKIGNISQQLWNFSKSPENPNLKQRLFGNQNYAYQIAVEGQFPAQVFKERNFGFKVKLIDSKNRIIKNSNPIKLHLGVCDNEGKWVTFSETDQNFLKGITQIQIYHGFGEFNKLSPKDISRAYPNKQLNFVICPQTTSLKYVETGNGYQQCIDQSQIEPLIIQKISIRAKRSKQG